MCRFIAYLGEPVMADELLIKPKNSLLSQSFHALESEMTVNGDGFGIGWYNKEIREEPALFRSIRPAWNDENLLYNAAMIRSTCLLGHIRAATQGSISIQNCHPFHYHQFLMMQNGAIEDFDHIKRLMVQRLNEDAFLWIQGQTDTQYIFALFMTIVSEFRKTHELTLDDIVICLRQTFEEIEKMKRKVNNSSPSVYNLVLTDGERMVATRYSTQPDKQMRSLHLARLSSFDMDGQGLLQYKNVEENRSVLIASEILFEQGTVWKEVPEGYCVLVDNEWNVKLKEI